MNDEAIRKGRKILKIIPAIISAIILATVVLAMLMPSGMISISEVEPISISAEGSELTFDGTYSIRSDLPYSIDDLYISLILIDRETRSHITIWKEDGICLNPGSSLDVKVQSIFFYPVLILFLKDVISHTDPRMDLNISASCGYMMDLVDIDVSAYLSSPLSQPGSSISYETTESDHGCSFIIRGLADHLIPDDAYVRMSDGCSWIDVDISTNSECTCVNIGSLNGFDQCLDSLKESDGLIVTDATGKNLNIDRKNIMMMLEAISLVRSIA